jgi:hypothetical protein
MSPYNEVAYDDLEYTTSGLFLLNGEPFSGATIDRDEAGHKVCEVLFVKGHENGVARSWHSNGQLQGETPYVDGMMHGIRREFSDDGLLRSEEVIEFGTLMRKEVRDRTGQVVDLYERQPFDPLYQNVIKRRAGA